MIDIDFWKQSTLDLREYGYYIIFAVYSGEYANKFIILKFKSNNDFKDFESLDKQYKIRYTSELYKSIQFSLVNHELKFYDSRREAITDKLNDIVKEIFKNNTKENAEEEIFKLNEKVIRGFLLY